MNGQLGTVLIAFGIASFWLSLRREQFAQLSRHAARAGARERATQAVRLGAAALWLAVTCALASWWLAGLPVLSVLAALAGGYLPIGVRRARRKQRARERERVWPSALEQLADGLEAGLAFPAATAFVARCGPSVLRGQFDGFHGAVREGRLEQGLEELAAAPERAAASAAALLRAAFLETPSGRVAPILRELAAVLRERWESCERARNRALSLEREATVLALSPIAFLLLIGATAPGYLNAYRSPGGTLVSLAGAAVIGGCYLAMRRLGRVAAPGETGPA